MKKAEYERKIYQAVGKRLVSARRGRRERVTQNRLSEITGLSRAAIANIEVGRQRVAIHQLYLIAEALGIEPVTLLPALEEMRGSSPAPAEAALPKDLRERAFVLSLTGPQQAQEKGEDAHATSSHGRDGGKTSAKKARR